MNHDNANTINSQFNEPLRNCTDCEWIGRGPHACDVKINGKQDEPHLYIKCFLCAHQYLPGEAHLCPLSDMMYKRREVSSASERVSTGASMSNMQNEFLKRHNDALRARVWTAERHAQKVVAAKDRELAVVRSNADADLTTVMIAVDKLRAQFPVFDPETQPFLDAHIKGLNELYTLIKDLLST